MVAWLAPVQKSSFSEPLSTQTLELHAMDEDDLRDLLALPMRSIRVIKEGSG